jgi:hypothetical protein
MISRIRRGTAATAQLTTRPGANAQPPVAGHSPESTFESSTSARAREALEPAFALVRIALHTNNEATLLKGARALASVLDVALPPEAASGAQALTTIGRQLVGAGFEFRGAADFKVLQREAIDAVGGGLDAPDAT